MENPNLEKLVKKTGKNVIIDWKFFHELEESEESKLGNTLYTEAVEKLKNLNILTANSEGNFVVVGRFVVINPRYHTGTLYFKKEEDATAYKKAAYGDVLYPIEIIKNN